VTLSRRDCSFDSKAASSAALSQRLQLRCRLIVSNASPGQCLGYRFYADMLNVLTMSLPWLCHELLSSRSNLENSRSVILRRGKFPGNYIFKLSPAPLYEIEIVIKYSY
jgi:hypothetical protein